MSQRPSISERQWWYGRDEPPEEAVLLRAGPVSLRLVGRDLRNLRFGGVELAQRVYVAVRDRNWDTVPGEVLRREVDAGEDRFAVRLEVRHRQPGVDVTWRGDVVGGPDGTVTYAIDAVAGESMTYKLIGLNIHHAARDYAGRQGVASTPDGPVAAVFGELVEPQLVVDESEVPIFPAADGLEITLAPGAGVRVRFEGDTFEFEDQRNWTDASFKSQSFPPKRGGVNALERGGRVWQQATIAPTGTPPPAAPAAGPVRVVLGRPGSTVPPVGLGAASHGRPLSPAEAAALRLVGPAHLRADLRLAAPDWPERLARAAADAAALGVPLELALHLGSDPEADLGRVAARLADGPPLARVLVFRDGEPATDPRWLVLARGRLAAVAPGVALFGGTDANFCELNRFRPDGPPGTGLAWSVTPQVHAFDETSLAENLAGQPDTVRTARAFAGDRPLLVGPVTLKPRFNAVATEAPPPLAAGELPPEVDPRQMSLFGAAWTVGSLARLLPSGVAALTYYETTGWRGVVQGDEPPAVPGRFPAGPGMWFPLAHVLADLAEWREGRVVAAESSDPLRVVALAVADADGLHLLLANLTPEPQVAEIGPLPPGQGTLRRLTAATVEAAAWDPDRFRAGAAPLAAERGPLVSLAPYEVARLDVGP